MLTPSPIHRRIGQQIKKIREEKNIPIAHIAYKTDLPAELIEKMERGEVSIGTTLLFELCDILKIEVQHFFARVEKNEKSSCI
ncbi:MAG: helix-turn-helix transcriptional regulator [Rhizobiales bacterium]|nr:helix-turn-helix transcriptional regulator [Hyphomicrobiales bacterium]